MPKRFSTGDASLDRCLEAIRRRAKEIGYEEARINELVSRLRDKEQDAFLWESVERHLETLDISSRDEQQLGLRISMNRGYLAVHRMAGIALPSGSGKVIPPHFCLSSQRHNNTLVIRRLLEMAGIFEDIALLSAQDLVQLKVIPEVAECLRSVRTALDRTNTTEEAFQGLRKDKAIGRLQNAVRKFKSLSREFKGSIMKNAIAQFKQDHAGTTVFVMTSLPKKANNTRIEDKKIDKLFAFICKHLQKYGLTAVRADKKNYVAETSNMMWDNVQVYLEACDYGIAILENLYTEQMNVNVAVEYGYQRGLGKPTLLLKDTNFENIAADLLGQMWREFSFEDMTTVATCLDGWMVDLGKPRITAD